MAGSLSGEFGMRKVLVEEAADPADAGVVPGGEWTALEKTDEPKTEAELAPAGVEGCAMSRLFQDIIDGWLLFLRHAESNL